MLAYQIAAQVQEEGELVVIFDPNKRFDPTAAKRAECKLEYLLISEEGYDELGKIARLLAESKHIALMLII